MDDLEAMEAQVAAAAGGTPQTPPVPVMVEQHKGDRSGYEIIADLLPVEQHRAFGTWCVRYKIGEDDPIFGGKLATNVAFNSASAATRAAEIVIDEIGKIPQIIQKSAFAASGEVAGQIEQALNSKIPDFASAIRFGIIKGTEEVATSINSASSKLEEAASKFDNDVDKTVIARRDAVLAQWVQSGSDSLEKRMQAALKKERLINVYLVVFLAFSMFLGGMVLGAHLHF